MPAVTQLQREVTANYTSVSHQTQTKYSQVNFPKNVRNYPIWGKCDRGLVGMERHSSINQLQFKIRLFRTSPVIQWIRICLPMQGPCQDNSTCYGAWSLSTTSTEPPHLNYRSLSPKSLCSVTRQSCTMRSPHAATKSSPHSPWLEKDPGQQWRPSTT